MIKRITIIFILISILLPLITLPPPISGASPSTSPTPELPEVYIELFNTSQTAHVEPGEDGIVEFNGMVSVKCDPDPITHVEVSLTVVDTWGSSKVIPAKTTFYQSGEEPFIVQVKVPSQERCDESGMVNVYGRWIMYPGGVSDSAEPKEGVVGFIDVAQFFRFTLSARKTIIETRPGSEVDLNLGIRNDGNGNDSFVIEVLNQDALDEKGISVTLSQSRVVLSEKASDAIIQILIDIPSSNSVIGQNPIRIGVYSENGLIEGMPPQVVRIVIDISKEYIFETKEFTISVILIIVIVIVCLIVIWRFRRRRLRDNEPED